MKSCSRIHQDSIRKIWNQNTIIELVEKREVFYLYRIRVMLVFQYCTGSMIQPFADSNLLSRLHVKPKKVGSHFCFRFTYLARIRLVNLRCTISAINKMKIRKYLSFHVMFAYIILKYTCIHNPPPDQVNWSLTFTVCHLLIWHKTYIILLSVIV